MITGLYFKHKESKGLGLNLKEAFVFAYLCQYRKDKVVSRYDLSRDLPLICKKHDTAYRALKSLESKGMVIEQDQKSEDIANVLKSKDCTGHGIGNKVCAWCHIYTITLHNHHYPIQKVDGGDKIVKICANCHQEFHSMKIKKGYLLNPIYLEFYG